MFNKLYYYLKRSFWYRDQGYNELTSPLNGMTAALSLFNFLILALNVKFPLWFYVLFVIMANMTLMVWGYVAVKKLNSLKITNKLNNDQNEMLKDILSQIKKKNGE